MVRTSSSRANLPVHSVITDPGVLVRIDKASADHATNRAFFEANRERVIMEARGRGYCITGGELFIAEGSLEALATARAKHPDDHGTICGFIRLVPRPVIV